MDETYKTNGMVADITTVYQRLYQLYMDIDPSDTVTREAIAEQQLLVRQAIETILTDNDLSKIERIERLVKQ